MQVSDPNNVKIYNLSAGKSLPDWLSDRKKRALSKKSVDIRKRIELIQDFEMPGVSTTVKVAPDGQYILATGVYKPRVRCFDVNHLSMKFERCFDSEAITFEFLSDDYSKVVFLQFDRYVEFHAAYGRYFRLRIPRFGRDLKYHSPSCDLFFVGAGPDIYRLNLERGQFMNSFVSEASEINKCAISPEHHLLVCGTKEGKVEAWDPRVRKSVGTLDCAINIATDCEVHDFPSITALKFEGPLTMGVGTASGHVLLYDIRSNKPFLSKDHMYGLPILDLDFYPAQDMVLSMDNSILKIWEKNSGKLFTSIEATSDFNNLCFVPNSGLMFIANENTKILTYYIPSLGPAPRWCGFLDALTEELEESRYDTVYDDYKFVTKKELEELGLDHLIGTNLLRAYMHGYFLDVRLYRKAKSVADPFAFEVYKKKKIKAKIEEDRENRVKLNMDEVDIDESDSNEPSSTSGILNYCKNKILHPYLQLLSVIGLRPVFQGLPEQHKCKTFINYIYFSIVLFLLILGYFLQGLSCLRRDRGFCLKSAFTDSSNNCRSICYGNITFSYVIPSVLHFTAYLYAVYLFRIVENEQLQNLMERVFLMTTCNADAPVHQKHLMRRLWLFIILSLFWIALSVAAVSVMMAKENIVFLWFEKSSVQWTTSMKVFLMIGTSCHDLVNVTIVTSYFLQVQLLITYLHSLKLKLLENSITSLDWLREIGTFQKLLEYLNNDFSPSVCLFAVVNIARAVSGVIWLTRSDKTDNVTLHINGISILNVILWIFLSLAPFIQAARLTSICRTVRNLGHEVRGRPFVYVDTPGDDLDTILLYTSSLRMTAKLYEISISRQCLSLCLTVSSIMLLTLGQCHLL